MTHARPEPGLGARGLAHGRPLLLVGLVALAGLALCGPRLIGGLRAPAASALPAGYTATVPGSSVTFEMVSVPPGNGVPGFWVGRHEVTWAEYDVFRADPQAKVRRADEPPPGADAITRPTPPYADETFGFGRDGMPALSITHHAAVEYARWLARRTGLPYRLPTEQEWERACRAGGDDEAVGKGRAWVRDNAGERPHPVGTRAANGRGVFDLVGNLAEWVQDGSDAPYPQVAKGGSWTDAGQVAGCAARRVSDPSWNERDPQDPQSIWWHTDATFVGFRVVRPFEAN
jgi:formylglycine-generating enzyme required for sulfatase activity